MPLAATLKVASAPWATVWLCGCVVIEGGTFTVRAALELVALPAMLRRTLQLAGQMTRDPRLDASRATPTHRLFLGTAVVAKARAVRAYRSQRGAIGKRFGRLVPPWIAVGLLPFEYFAEA